MTEEIAALTEAIRLNPNNAVAYGKRGAAYASQGDYDHAITDLNAAIRLNPNNASAYSNRGVAYLKKGNYDQAITDFSAAIRFSPNNATAYSRRGFAYANQRDYERAINDFAEAVRLDPNDAKAAASLAKVKAAEHTTGGQSVNRADKAGFRQENYGRTMTESARGNGMLGFVKSAFRKFFGALLWFNLVLCVIIGGIAGYIVLRVVGVILGILVGAIIAMFTNIVSGGLMATILNMDKSLEHLANNTRSAS
jgi:tetratricopeptide (TPR) repeat protein